MGFSVPGNGNSVPIDEYQSFVADGHITIVKKIPGAAKGIIKQVKSDTSVNDEASLQSALDQGPE